MISGLVVVSILCAAEPAGLASVVLEQGVGVGAVRYRRVRAEGGSAISVRPELDVALTPAARLPSVRAGIEVEVAGPSARHRLHLDAGALALGAAAPGARSLIGAAAGAVELGAEAARASSTFQQHRPVDPAARDLFGVQRWPVNLAGVELQRLELVGPMIGWSREQILLPGFGRSAAPVRYRCARSW